MSSLINSRTVRSVYLLILISAGCGIIEEDQTVINPVLIGKGELYGAGAEGISMQNIVISDSAAWNELMSKMDSVNNVTGSFSETEIDFSNNLILAAFDQIRPSGGYSIEIKSIREFTGSIIVNIENVIPVGVVTGVITQPYHIVKIPKKNKQIVFE